MFTRPTTFSRRAAIELLVSNLPRQFSGRKAYLSPRPSISFHLDNTAAFVHLLPGSRIQTASTEKARAVRVQVLTPPSALSRDGQKQLVREITEILAKIAGDETLPRRTWVLLTEGTPGGWGIAGTAFGKEEFTALAQGNLKP
jgi:phenylpyruvate tautomerase PptA (4-oxalocrotonate tautomerase family)